MIKSLFALSLIFLTSMAHADYWDLPQKGKKEALALNGKACENASMTSSRYRGTRLRIYFEAVDQRRQNIGINPWARVELYDAYGNLIESPWNFQFRATDTGLALMRLLDFNSYEPQPENPWVTVAEIPMDWSKSNKVQSTTVNIVDKDNIMYEKLRIKSFTVECFKPPRKR